MTESSPAPKTKGSPEPKRASRAAKVAVATVAAAPAPAVALPAVSIPAVAAEPAHRHPNLGLAPADMTAGFPAAAEALRRDKLALAAKGLQAAFDADPELQGHFDQAGTVQLLRDADLLIERLSMCVASDDPRWMAGYVEWVGPILRRRRVSQWDLAALCEGIRAAVAPALGPKEMAAADRALNAAVEVFRKNGRVGGDPHKRNALAKWLYRGV